MDEVEDVVTYRQLKVEPPEAFKQIINPALFKLLKMKKIGVLFLDVPDAPWAGFCRDKEYSQNGEIVMNEYLVEEKINKTNSYSILHTYLHEASHRLCPGQGHNAVFFFRKFITVLTIRNTSKYDLESNAFVRFAR